jgi:hypothetical protein
MSHSQNSKHRAKPGVLEGPPGDAQICIGARTRIFKREKMATSVRFTTLCKDFCRGRSPLGNRADVNVAIVDEPAIAAVRIRAAGEDGHRAFKRITKPAATP